MCEETKTCRAKVHSFSFTSNMVSDSGRSKSAKGSHIVRINSKPEGSLSGADFQISFNKYTSPDSTDTPGCDDAWWGKETQSFNIYNINKQYYLPSIS